MGYTKNVFHKGSVQDKNLDIFKVNPLFSHCHFPASLVKCKRLGNRDKQSSSMALTHVCAPSDLSRTSPNLFYLELGQARSKRTRGILGIRSNSTGKIALGASERAQPSSRQTKLRLMRARSRLAWNLVHLQSLELLRLPILPLICFEIPIANHKACQG